MEKDGIAKAEGMVYILIGQDCGGVCAEQSTEIIVADFYVRQAPFCKCGMAGVHHIDHDLPGESFWFAGVLKERHIFSPNLT